jgi:hypothetical protein
MPFNDIIEIIYEGLSGTVSIVEIEVPGPSGPVGPAGPAGPAGSGVSILGSRPTAAELPTGATTGDGYLVAGDLYIWSGTAWVNVGSVQGPMGFPGIQGPIGATGPIGPTGATGADSAVPGPAGPVGPVGPAGIPISVEYFQIDPQSTWIIPVPTTFARTPSVDVFLVNGEKIIADIVATSLSVTVIFASPAAGSAILT